MQAILSISSESLDNLANMADKIAEVRISSADNSVFAFSRGAESTAMQKASTMDEFTALRSEITALSKQVQRLSRDRSRGPFHRKNTAQFSRVRSGDRGRKCCYYHSRFGKKALKCLSPCSYPTNVEQENSQ
ncbi:hypothetical protein HNY73_007746 [Argiope bruennichi]|uniref:Uncharacterized protein n=1 Tax=Argiope bruennichi TaxID=94029 RepID=A0A8T0FFL8_ARGBR|nr:hypothetical protein HNY73_007746 [Argiope bruennichi]